MSTLPVLRGGTLKLVRELASRGVRDVDIANALHLSLPRWQKLRASHPKVMSAYEEGRSSEHAALRNALFDAATQKYNVTAAIFLLKSRHGYVDQPQQQPEAGRVTVEFKLPAPLSPAQYVELTKVAEKATATVLMGEVAPLGGNDD
jgi:hypothetical protein